MKFDIILPIAFSKLENFEFEMYEEDSLIEALSIVENALDEIEGSKFYFNALKEIWNVTVFGDFSVFLEQLLKIVSVIKEKNDSYILDFYDTYDINIQNKIFSTYKTQLIMYSLMIEDNFNKEVKKGYIVYTRSKNHVEEIEINHEDKNKLKIILENIMKIIHTG